MALALCLLCGLTACGKKGEEASSAPESDDTASSAVTDGTSSAAAEDGVDIPLVVVPEPRVQADAAVELTVQYVDMVEVINVNEGSTLNVREGPGTDYASIGSAQPGQRFLYLGAENGWNKIQYNEVEAYVSGEFSQVISVAQ